MSNPVELCDMNPVVNNCVVYNNCIYEELLYCDLMEGVAHGDLHGGTGACERLIKMVLVQQQKLSDINSKLQVMLQKMELYRQGQNMNNMLR